MNPLIFTKIIAWFADPKNRQLISIGIIAALIIMLMVTCGRVSNLKGAVKAEKKETQRVSNNWEASMDSVKMALNKNGELVGTISGYDIKLNELESDYEELLGAYNIEKNKPPVTITETVTEVRDTTIYVDAAIVGDSLISVSDSAVYSTTNWRYLSGTIPFAIDTALNKINLGQSIFNLEQSMTLQTVLTRDKKTGKIQINVTTAYPGVTFPSIQGAVIQDDKENAKVLRQARKEFSVGVNVGYGAMLNLMDINRIGIAHGPYVGVGLNYSPKWAQWGK
jgi:hypothetical protein